MHLRISVTLVMLIASCFSSLAQSKAKAKVAGAKFKFEETTHDFGNLKEGDPAKYEFVFTNTGTEPLIIQDCKASCGCTTPSWPKEPIMPGATGRITVVFDTKNKNGTFLKSIWITSNAVGDRPVQEIYIKGNVTAK
jgi:hypothetical protein